MVVGDIVKGVNNHYRITNSSMIRGRILDIYDEEIQVKIMSHTCGGYIGNTYWVEAKYFEKIGCIKPFVRSKVKNILELNFCKIALAVMMVIGIILLFICTIEVPFGYIVVQYNINGSVHDEVLTQGSHLVSPTINTVGIEQSYLTAENKGDSKNDESFSASSSEEKAVQIDLTLFTSRK